MHQRILVAMDDSPPSRAALAEAISLVKQAPGAAIRIVAAIELPRPFAAADGLDDESYEARARDDAAMLLEETRTIARRDAVEPETAVVACIEQPVAEALVEEAIAWGADVIVMGTHGRRGLARFFQGSVAESVARIATVPVMLVTEEK